MKYPVPKNKELFFWFNEEKKTVNNTCDDVYSWTERNILLDDFLNVINKYGWLYRSFPFIKNIYLCNSITFNAIDSESDIDFFLVVKKNRLWTARFFSVVISHLLGLRWWKKKQTKKIDLGFYISEDVLNIYNICLKPYDLYMIYWLIHLVPLYSEKFEGKNIIFNENKWIKNYLPNWNGEQTINLGNDFFEGNSLFKKILEKIFGGLLGDIFESLIKFIWLPIVMYKTKKQGNHAWGILISDKILKFHGSDIRKIVNLKYSVFNKK